MKKVDKKGIMGYTKRTMKKAFLGIIFLPLVITNFDSANIETTVRNEASGDNASVHTEITNIVNEKEVKVESDEQGEIKVEVKNGQITVESETQSSPTVVITDSEEDEMTEEEKQEIVEEIVSFQEKFVTLIEDFFSRLRERLFFWR